MYSKKTTTEKPHHHAWHIVITQSMLTIALIMTILKGIESIRILHLGHSGKSETNMDSVMRDPLPIPPAPPRIQSRGECMLGSIFIPLTA